MAHLAGPNTKLTKEAKKAFFSKYSILSQLAGDLLSCATTGIQSLQDTRAGYHNDGA